MLSAEKDDGHFADFGVCDCASSTVVSKNVGADSQHGDHP